MPAKTRRKPATQRRPSRAPATTTSNRRGWQQHKNQIQRTNSRMRTTGRRITRSAGRYAKRRGAIFGVLSLAVAATAFTLAATGALSEIAAFELGLASDGLALGVSWLIGEPRSGGPSPAQKAINKARAPLCGAPTEDGSPCKRRGACPHHKKSTGGKGQPKKPGQPNFTSTKNKGQFTAAGRKARQAKQNTAP